MPIAVQQTLDRGLNGPDGPDVGFTVLMGAGRPPRAIVVTSCASYLMTSRLFTTSERGLATLRIKAFRHVHDLPLLTQNTERRGALVSRVTSDVDQVSQFLVFGGLIFIVSVGQMLVATVVMLIYSWQLAIVVWVCFAPLFLSLRYFQRKLSDGLRHRPPPGRRPAVRDLRAGRRRRGGPLLRRRGPHPGADRRTRSTTYKAASTRAQGFTAFSFSLGGISAGLANAGVLIVGIWLGFADDITAGEVLAFAFLVTLFVGPVQMGTQILTDAQNAIAGWRRVIGILETPADLVDPGPDGADPAARPDRRPLRRRHLRLPRRPAGAARRRPAHRLRHPDRDRRRDRLRQVDVRQAAHPADGPDARARCSSTASTCATSRQASLRRSVVLVPQEGFLFDDTLAANVRYGRLDATDGRHPAPAPTSSASATGWPACRAGSTPRSASAASRCRRASGSWSRCSAPTSPTPTCWSSTRRPAPSTPPWRCGSAGRSSG